MQKLSNSQIKKRFDDFAKHYDFAETFTQLIVGRYRKKLLSNLKGNILEVGIGTGVNLKYYSKSVKLSGIDLSENMLNYARLKSNKLGLNSTLVVGNVQSLPFKSNRFDFVVDTLGLCTYPDPIKALKEMQRVCKKDGKIILLEHGISNISFIQKLLIWIEPKHYPKIGCSLLRNHQDIVKQSNLNIISSHRSLLGILYTIIAKP